MGDSELSASELRKRYGRGGTVKDDELTAAQLRARHGVHSNAREFSTSQKDKIGGGLGPVPIAIALIVMLAVIFLSYNFLLK